MIQLPVEGGQTVVIAPTKIIAVGLNYREHVKESRVFAPSDLYEPAEPVLFAKTPNVLIGDGQPIIIPAFLRNYAFSEPRVDIEAELALVINRRCRNIRASEAWDYILGFTAFNDVSQRNLQKTDVSGWFRGKSLDSFGPIGPKLVLPDRLPAGRSLRIQSRINGRTVQSASTADMIFSVAALIAFISSNFSLEAGDIIATGTPSGVSPIVAGDTVEVEIEGIGVLRNPVLEEA